MDTKIARYARFGLIGGTALGTFTGFIVSGPHLHTWSPSLVLSVVAGSAVLGALIGYFALARIVGALVRGGPHRDIGSGMDDGLVTVVAELPGFDTGEYEGCEFSMGNGGASLSVRVVGLAPISFYFTRVRWHQFTALYNCTPEMVRDAYFKVVAYPSSKALEKFVREDRAGVKAYRSLSHYRIFLDETGCHEVFAESFATSA